MAGKEAKKKADKRRSRAYRTTPVRVEIKIATLPQALDTFEKLIGAFYRGRMKREKFTGIVYALNGYAAYLRLQIEKEITARIEALEKAVEERGNRGN